MFSGGELIYIKKYMGNSLEPDTNKIYAISNIIKNPVLKYGNYYK